MIVEITMDLEVSSFPYCEQIFPTKRPTNPKVYSFPICSSCYVFTGTARGGVFRSINSKASLIDKNNTTSSTFSLKQNYPNLFNSSTFIKYSILNDGMVNISVYSLLSEKIATIVNEVQKVGSYEVNFYPNSLSSGVYFYKLQVGNFIETRKMLLMK